MWKHDVSQSVPWLIGACILLPRSVFTQVGGFDPAFFMYAEETDLQKRIRSAGYDIHLCAETQVTHLGGGSGTSESETVRQYFYASQDLYMHKHFGFLGFVTYRLMFGLCSALRCVAWTSVANIRQQKDATSKRKADLYAFTTVRSFTKWSTK